MLLVIKIEGPSEVGKRAGQRDAGLPAFFCAHTSRALRRIAGIGGCMSDRSGGGRKVNLKRQYVRYVKNETKRYEMVDITTD